MVEMYWEIRNDIDHNAATFMRVVKQLWPGRKEEQLALEAMLEKIMDRLDEIQDEEKLELEF